MTQSPLIEKFNRAGYEKESKREEEARAKKAAGK